jgi:hypothetical protein
MIKFILLSTVYFFCCLPIFFHSVGYNVNALVAWLVRLKCISRTPSQLTFYMEQWLGRALARAIKTDGVKSMNFKSIIVRKCQLNWFCVLLHTANCILHTYPHDSWELWYVLYMKKILLLTNLLRFCYNNLHFNVLSFTPITSSSLVFAVIMYINPSNSSVLPFFHFLHHQKSLRLYFIRDDIYQQFSAIASFHW